MTNAEKELNRLVKRVGHSLYLDEPAIRNALDLVKHGAPTEDCLIGCIKVLASTMRIYRGALVTQESHRTDAEFTHHGQVGQS